MIIVSSASLPVPRAASIAARPPLHTLSSHCLSTSSHANFRLIQHSRPRLPRKPLHRPSPGVGRGSIRIPRASGLPDDGSGPEETSSPSSSATEDAARQPAVFDPSDPVQTVAWGGKLPSTRRMVLGGLAGISIGACKHIVSLRGGWGQCGSSVWEILRTHAAHLGSFCAA